MTQNWKERFAEIVNEAIGSEAIEREIKATKIYKDVKDVSLLISSDNIMLDNHPLIIYHEYYSLIAFIPYKDYERLEKGEIDPGEYISNAFWSYGYAWCGYSIFKNLFWQPLEEGAGIRDKEKISRYLRIMKCRTYEQSTSNNPVSKKCQKCFVEKCPFLPPFSWKNEPKENDWRLELTKELIKRTETLFKIKIYDYKEFTISTMKTVGIRPVMRWKNGYLCADMWLPAQAFVDILCNPGDRDWKKMAEEFQFELIEPDCKKTMLLDKEIKEKEYANVLRKFWKIHFEPLGKK